MFQIIYQFALFFLQQTYLQKMVLSINIKGPLKIKKTEAFLQNLYQYDWYTIKTHQDANEAYKNFISTFCTIYNTFFSMKKLKLKTEDLEGLWITKGIKKSSKKEKRLYSKLFKKGNKKTKTEYQDYKELFESIKKCS